MVGNAYNRIGAMRNISFEFFPPKTLEGTKSLARAAEQLEGMSPDFFSVTYGAGGSTRQGTINAITMLQNHTTIPIAPHLACIGSTRKEILETLVNYQALKVNRIIALRGDLPLDTKGKGEFDYAYELVEFIRDKMGDALHIEVAAYPECHPQAQNALEDIIQLKRKFDVGANSAITQYFFNADAYFYFIDKCARHGIYNPITPGIMPITNFAKLVRFSQICGADVPRWLYKNLEAYGNDEESVKAFGLDVVYALCDRLVAGGAPGLHFYTLNHADTSLALLKLLKIKIEQPVAV